MNATPHNYDQLPADIIGEGHRLLSVTEACPEGYEFWNADRWTKGRDVGHVVGPLDQVTRRVRA